MKLYPEPVLVRNALGHEFRYGYDIMGRRTSVTTDYGRVEIGYNNRDEIIYIKDGNGGIQQRKYDPKGNLITLCLPREEFSQKSYAIRPKKTEKSFILCLEYLNFSVPNFKAAWLLSITAYD